MALTNSEISDKIEQFVADCDTMHLFVQGGKTVMVNVGGVQTPTLSYFSEKLNGIENEAAESAEAASLSEANAKTSETNASKSEASAKTSETNAKTSETNAASSADSADASKIAAQTVATAAAEAVSAASNYADAAANSADNAAQSALDAAAALPDNFVWRVEQVEEKTQPATTTSSGIARVATLADMEPGVTVENGPAVLAAGSEAERLLLRVTDKYEIGEFYLFRHPSLRTGFAPCQGGILANAVTQHPEIWAYLQTAEGQLLLKTEAEWQAMSTATWATLADGTKVGWNGIGGVPYYVQDLATGTLRLPDLRGMYAEAAGFDSLGVGGVQGDQARWIRGTLSRGGGVGLIRSDDGGTGPYAMGAYLNTCVASTQAYSYVITFDSSRVVPTGPANAPRRWGALACCYLGAPAS